MHILGLLLSVSFLYLPEKVFGQKSIDIIESTKKIPGGGEETYYFGFAAGDQVVFNFEEVNGKPLKELEIGEYPNSSMFMEFKVSKIDNKRINVLRTGIYVFRFKNSAISGRVCKFKIQRLPSQEETINFNSSVYWESVNDTVFTDVEEKYIISSDTSIHNITDQVAKVHSVANPNGNKNTFNFELPQNTVTWSYYVGVDQAGQEAYEQASKELSIHVAPGVAKIPGYGPLAALALGSVHYISRLQKGEDVEYYLVEGDNYSLFNNDQPFHYIKKGKVINDFSLMTTTLKGTYHFCLLNDNAVMGINVVVKVTAIVVTENWGTRNVQKMKISSIQKPYLKSQ